MCGWHKGERRSGDGSESESDDVDVDGLMEAMVFDSNSTSQRDFGSLPGRMTSLIFIL